MENFKNEIYENLGLSEKTQERIINAMENVAKSNLTPDTDNIRRIKSMRKNTHSDILKKVAVASLSLGLSGALIAGVILYTNGNYNNKKISAKKVTQTTENIESTEKNKEKNTVKNTEKETTKSEITEDIMADSDTGVNIYAIENKFKKLDLLYYANSYQRVQIDKWELRLIENDKKKGAFDICLQTGKEKEILVDSIQRSRDSIEVSFCSYGENVYYFDKNGLKELNINTQKVTRLFKYTDSTKEVCKAFPNTNLSHRYSIFKIDDKHIYFSICAFTGGIAEDDPVSNLSQYMYCYDINEKNVRFLKNRYVEETIDDEYYLTSEIPKDFKGDIPNQENELLFIEKITDGKAEEIKSFEKHTQVYLAGENADWYTDENDGENNQGLQFSESNPHKLYYILCNRKNKETEVYGSSIGVYSKCTIMSYDIDTNKEEQVAYLESSELNFPDDFYVEVIKDDYCLISSLVKNKNYDENSEEYTPMYLENVYVYDFKTKKLEEKATNVE